MISKKNAKNWNRRVSRTDIGTGVEIAGKNRSITYGDKVFGCFGGKTGENAVYGIVLCGNYAA